MDADQGDIDTGKSKDAPKEKRPTVNVACSMPNGLVMQLHAPIDPNNKLPEGLKLGDRIVLKAGGNPGIDKEYFDHWMAENRHLSVVEAGMITATDEKEAEDADEHEQQAAE